tara:strand:+ start:1238 stop:2269 length:1032 start_codon:yes stop_codon:yes gene_type:complete
MASKNEESDYSDRGLTGLANLGNTCFINSAVQCISHTYLLNDFLNKETYKKRINKIPETLLLLEWDKLRKLMWSDNCIIKPSGFLSAIHKVARLKNIDIFTGYAQNDLTEFLHFFVDCFHEAIKREVNMTIRGNVENSVDKLAKVCYEMKKNMYKKEYSDFLDMFFGMHVSTINSKESDYENISPEPFFILSVPLTENKTLLDSFDEYCKIEMLDDDNKVEVSDGNKETCEKRIMFWSLPDILVITLKRFSNMNRKNKSLIDFPLHDLDLSKYVVGYNKSSYVYDLYGVCNHSGGVSGGHYTAHVKNANGNWYNFNDTNVSRISENKIVSTMAYCLFYRKKIS